MKMGDPVCIVIVIGHQSHQKDLESFLERVPFIHEIPFSRLRLIMEDIACMQWNGPKSFSYMQCERVCVSVHACVWFNEILHLKGMCDVFITFRILILFEVRLFFINSVFG